MSLKFIKLNVCFSIDSIAKLVRRSCDTDDLKYVLISFNLLKERSQLATETDIVKRISDAVRRFGHTSLPYCIVALSNCSGDDGTSELSLCLNSHYTSYSPLFLVVMNEVKIKFKWHKPRE